MSTINIWGMNSINDFWCYKNGNRKEHGVAMGNGSKPASFDWEDGDFITVTIRIGLQDFCVYNLKYDESLRGEVRIVRDHDNHGELNFFTAAFKKVSWPKETEEHCKLPR